MSDHFLRHRLTRVIRRHQWAELWRKLAVWWSVAAAAVFLCFLIQRRFGWSAPEILPVLAAVSLAVAAGIVIHHFLHEPDLRWVAQQIEKAHPELDGVLLTAVQQGPGDAGNYLQHRVLQEAILRSQEADWRKVVPASQVFAAHIAHLIGLGCLVFALFHIHVSPIHGVTPAWVGADGVSVSPGDATIERGDSLVVLARFDGALPPAVTLVVRESGAPPRPVPLVKSLADPVFGGSVSEVGADFIYHLEYGARRTPEYRVTVYEHPRLVRSDVTLTFPDYTKLPPKRIEDTRRVSAVEGTALDIALQLNKPVRTARLLARDGGKTVVPLTTAADRAVASLGGFVPAGSLTYDLELIDAEGRMNKVAAPFVIDVQPNRAPEIRIAAPRGDLRPSALEEVTFEGTVWDDFGASVYGLAYSIGGGELQSIELGRDLAGKERRAFTHVLRLEELGVKPDDLLAWHAWAEDVGPDGTTRRTSGDLYFAEVRPFDEIFRESQDMPPGGEQQGDGAGSQARRLTDLQKQIINATWRLQRDGATPQYSGDIAVVTDSQKQALAQAGVALERVQAPRERALWREAARLMERAAEKLQEAAAGPGPLAEALPAEQAAYQELLKLQARETAVTRNQRQQGGGGGGGNQRQIDQLDLQQSENRYETQRQARAPQSQERREQLVVMNRLQELARRQQDLNERMRELQAALQEARTERERDEIRRRLKRLQEEQQQMLADVDEVRQRMDRTENQSRMSQERQQLDQTRGDVQRAAEAAADGSMAQALASGTRAQRQLQELRDEMRRQNSSQFAEDMRDMRSTARELAERQEAINQQIDALAGADTRRKSLGGDGPDSELLEQLEAQRGRMDDLMERATQVSEQAENTEPLLARQLYDSIRKASQDDANSVKQAREDLLAGGQLNHDLRDRLQRAAEREGSGKALEVTQEMLRSGALVPASGSARRARAGIEELRRGVERAAESVLGDEIEQLRMAQSELDDVADQLRRELDQANSGEEQGAGGDPQQDGRLADGSGSRAQGDGGRGEFDLDRFLDGADGGGGGIGGWEGGGDGRMRGPLTGEAFNRWAERLRDVEELLDSPELRSTVAAARERARLVRRDFRQDLKKPDWAVVRMEILEPLVEVRSRVADELSRRESKDSLAPIDRDPVPQRFAEALRRYYEELGKDR